MSRTRNLAITEGCQRHITVNELSAIGQYKMHNFETFAFELL